MRIKSIEAKKIYDSRKSETICVFVRTLAGVFSCSSPSGKSTGKFEAKPYLISINEDIKTLEKINLGKVEIHKFEDLEKIENIIRDKIGANSLFALEGAVLKALAYENKKQVWQIINNEARKLPIPVGNCIGGGVHTKNTKGEKPDFQEFLVIVRAKSFADRVFLMNKFYEMAGERLRLRKAKGSLNDESAFSTSLSNEEVLEIMQETREEISLQLDYKIGIGIDAASSQFYTGYLYNYKNKKQRLNEISQINYLVELANKFSLEYIEDPLSEEAFSDFRLLRESIIKTRPCLIVGDDLTATSIRRLKMAIEKGSINGIIIKPNQNGSLIEVGKIVELAKKYRIATIFSHRSGETMETIIADLAFGFQSDFVKFGINGKEREAKLNRLIEIEKSLR